MSDIETGAGNLRTEDQLRLAIKEFQVISSNLILINLI